MAARKNVTVIDQNLVIDAHEALHAVVSDMTTTAPPEFQALIDETMLVANENPDETHEDAALKLIELHETYENQESTTNFADHPQDLELQANEPEAGDLDDGHYTDEAESDGETETWTDRLNLIDPEDTADMKTIIADALDIRAAYETEKNPDNATIQATLKKARKNLVWDGAANVLAAASVNPSFVNSGGSKRYNVYAIGKLADIVRSLHVGEIFENAVNRHVITSLLRVTNLGLPFTMDLAKAAVCDKLKVDDAVLAKVLSRHTVSPSTASTQASSTMQALETLGIVVGTGAKNTSYRLSTHPIVDRLREVALPVAA